MTVKLTVGVLLFSLSILAMFLNFVIFAPVFRLAFIEKKSTIYIIAFFNIIIDFLILCSSGLYLSTSMIADRYLLTEERITSLSILIGGIYMNSWYMECLIQIVMAVNRFTVITLNKQHIFTFKSTLVIFFFLISVTAFSAVCTQHLFPCCLIVIDHDLMTYFFIQIEGVYSYSNLMLVIYDALCTTVSTICYIGVFVSIRKQKAKVSSDLQKKQVKQDAKLLLQFVLISVFYVCGWVLFEILPFLIPADQKEWFVLVPVLVTLNCSTCAIIYLTMNKEVQRSVKASRLGKIFGGAKPFSQVHAAHILVTN